MTCLALFASSLAPSRRDHYSPRSEAEWEDTCSGSKTEELRPLREIRVQNVSNLDFEKAMSSRFSLLDASDKL
jgi:hypothetical protein